MRWLPISALVACTACQFAREPRPRPNPAPSLGLEAKAPAAAADTARDEAIFLVRSRFGTEPPLPGDAPRTRCTDEALDRAETRLPLRLRDVRADRRQILPLRLRLALTTESAARATRLVDPNQALEAPGSASAQAREEREQVERLAKLHYVSELQIDTYRAPKLFRRKDAPRSEWSPAMLSGKLVVYELSGFRALCQAPISVLVSGDGEPIRRRLRDTVREKLTTELERRVREELERALAGISGAFSLEPSPTAAKRLRLAGLEP
jgi:hypothetical protein